MRRDCLALFLVLLLCPWQAMAETRLEGDTSVAREGYFVLTWQSDADANAQLRLEQALSPAFGEEEVITYVIPAAGAITITGLVDGNYYFRAGTPAQGWSDTLMVTVAHHSLARAWLFFTLGLSLFLVLCAVILLGTRVNKGAAP